ncbi:MAG: DsrE/DsrF/DrsH-like family protein [Candidatus Nanopelagicales bacterium]
MTVIPNFDAEDTDRKLFIICTKGNLDMVYPALIIANAAVGEGIETHLFFSFWGFDMIIDSRMDDLKFSPLGNTAMHFPVKGKDVRVPQAVMPLPGMTGMATRMLKDQIEELGIPPVRDFLDQIVASGAHLWACKMSADMNKVDMDDLYEGVEGILNASDMISMADGAQMLFI